MVSLRGWFAYKERAQTGTCRKSLVGSAAWRSREIRFVLQESRLIGSLSIAGNIKLLLLYAGAPGKEHCQVVTLWHWAYTKQKPFEYSGGETRTVFARAVIMNPMLFLLMSPLPLSNQRTARGSSLCSLAWTTIRDPRSLPLHMKPHWLTNMIESSNCNERPRTWASGLWYSLLCSGWH